MKTSKLCFHGVKPFPNYRSLLIKWLLVWLFFTDPVWSESYNSINFRIYASQTLFIISSGIPMVLSSVIGQWDSASKGLYLFFAID